MKDVPQKNYSDEARKEPAQTPADKKERKDPQGKDRQYNLDDESYDSSNLVDE